MPCADEMRGYGSNELMPRRDFKCKRRMLESTAKKIKIVKPGDKVTVPVPDLDRAKIDAHSLHAVIVEEYSNVQFMLGTRYIFTLVRNKILKISIK